MTKKTGSRKKKKKLSGISIAAIFLLAVIALLTVYFLFQALKSREDNNDGKTAVEFFFYNPTDEKWVVETRYIEEDTEKKMLETVLSEWSGGPKSASLKKNLPDNVDLSAKYIVGGTVEITFSDSYNELSPVDSSMCNASLVYSLTSLSFIDSVHIYVGQMELLYANGSPVGLLTRDDFLFVSNEVTHNKVEPQTITLYFSGVSGSLVAEQREIEIDTSIALEKYIIEELIKGTTSEGHYSTVPQDVKLNSVRTESGVCYVDFSPAFKTDGGSTSEGLMVYSIVNSLTELSHIKRVQFFINGEKITETAGFNMDLGTPIERNADAMESK